jgi:adenosylcobinamide-phosphate synthase
VYLDIALLAFIIDRILGELKYIKHPVIFMGDFIILYEKYMYKDSIIRGALLTIVLLWIVASICIVLELFLPWWAIAIISSMGIASNMLYSSVKDIIKNPQNIKYLVSRDTKNLSSSDINKAAIETYGENFSDGVIAPIFYLVFFGIVGLFVYKSINTLDSMIGYRNERYERFGKFAAILDDIVNYIPSRITAVIISTLMLSKKAIKNTFKYGSLHDSPNAGYPISAIAGVCDISLGGPTSYFGKIKNKPYFGDGAKEINANHILKALSFQKRFNIFIILILGVYIVL